MKKWCKGFIIAGAVLLTLGAGSGAFIASMTCFRKYEQTNTSLTKWMGTIDDEARLNEIVLPGSHDAGTNGMSWLGKTQHLSVKEQLNLGVRYFDLRVNHVKNDYVIYHSIINGTRFDPILDDIASFIEENPSETLFLDFQHFKNGSDEYVYHTVSEKLKDHLVIQNDVQSELAFVDELRLKDTRGKCIVFFGDDSPFVKEAHIFSRNNDACTQKGQALDSCYISSYHAMKSKQFIDEALGYYMDKIQTKKEKEGHKGIFVWQCQLTDSKLVFGPYHRERGHEANMNAFIENLPQQDYFSDINVIMRDFLDEAKVESIVKLNASKGLLK